MAFERATAVQQVDSHTYRADFKDDWYIGSGTLGHVLYPLCRSLPHGCRPRDPFPDTHPESVLSREREDLLANVNVSQTVPHGGYVTATLLVSW